MALKTPKLDTSAKQSAYSSYLDEEEKKNVPEEDDSYLAGYEPGSFGYQNAKANRPTGLSANASEAIPGLISPSQYVQDALSMSPEKRTSAQREALKVRRRNEEIAAKGGRRVQGGITQDLINEEVAPDIGRRETKAALAYKNASEQTLAENGRNPDGSKMSPEDAAATPDTGSPTPTPSASKATSGGTITKGSQTVSVPGQPAGAAPSGPAPRGFAMRTMADGTVKTASGVVGNNSNIQTFGTQDEAMAYYRPQPAQVPNGPAGTPPTMMTAHTGQPAAYAQPQAAPVAPAPVAPSGASAQTPAAARTTSPTQQLATSIAQGPAPAAPATRPPSGNPREPMAENPPAPAMAPANPYPVNPFLADQLSQQATNQPAPAQAQSLAAGPVARPPTPLYGRGLSKAFKPDLPSLATANREFGTPKRRTGYQQQAEELNPMVLHR